MEIFNHFMIFLRKQQDAHDLKQIESKWDQIDELNSPDIDQIDIEQYQVILHFCFCFF